MYSNNHNRFSIGLIATCVAALASPVAGAAAEVPSVGADVHAGQIGTGVESEQVRSETDAQVDSTTATAQRSLANTQAKLRDTQNRLRRVERQLRTELSTTKAKADGEVANRRRSALRTATRLQSQVRQLRIDVMRISIVLARSTADGAWVVVNRSGDVLNQSGGASVTREGRGWYTVQFDTSRTGCANVSSSNPAPAGSDGGVRVSSDGSGVFSVRVSDSSGPRNGGFFLALSC